MLKTAKVGDKLAYTPHTTISLLTKNLCGEVKINASL